MEHSQKQLLEDSQAGPMKVFRIELLKDWSPVWFFTRSSWRISRRKSWMIPGRNFTQRITQRNSWKSSTKYSWNLESFWILSRVLYAYFLEAPPGVPSGKPQCFPRLHHELFRKFSISFFRQFSRSVFRKFYRSPQERSWSSFLESIGVLSVNLQELLPEIL